ncbi:MAG: hypothetical protein HC852_13735 [Acaryochloridaceae cyanobacterium RU_4_10]|nr:hypothetical protein [Acaryochloridaceae cyanobacterium RU_4_10]
MNQNLQRLLTFLQEKAFEWQRSQLQVVCHGSVSRMHISMVRELRNYLRLFIKLPDQQSTEQISLFFESIADEIDVEDGTLT